jgi:hypothetical protein
MNVYIITMVGDPDSLSRSVRGLATVAQYTDFHITETFPATTPDTIYEGMMETFGKTINWSWPVDPSGDGLDFLTGLYKRAYASMDPNRVVACALSHFRLWKKCVELDEPIMVLEHDARFIRELDYSDLETKNWGAVGLNDPRGNTRKGLRFHDLVASCGEGIHRVPIIDEPTDPPLPMGLAGNSAYIIKPYFADLLLKEVERVGMWPNDAIMCRQLFPLDLKVVYPYYTEVERGVSTTTEI